MGESLFFLWFGKSVDELKAIYETDKTLTEAERKELERMIKQKQNQ